MRKIKIIPVLAVTLLWGCLLAWGLHKETIPDQTPIFNIQTGTHTTQIKAWLDQRDSCYYLFLPSYAHIDDVTYLSSNLPITIGNRPLDYGDNLPHLQPNQVYSLTSPTSTPPHKFSIVQSANVPTLFIDIDQNLLTHINKNREVKASAAITLLSSHGALLHRSTGDSVKLKGRGDTSWQLDKKPYTLILSQPLSLLGMPASTRWVLLANGFDESNLKNKIVYHFAQTLHYGWTPHCEYVDLYINNTYHGLYLLSEKIELSKLQSPDGQQPQHLFKFDQKEPQSLPFHYDQYVVPVEGISHISLFRDDMARLKTAILQAPSDTTHQLEQTIDLHSWACKYLIDALFANTDAWWKSHYFYCSAQRPFLFYEGPIWDYDLAWLYPANSFVRGNLSDSLELNAPFMSQVLSLYHSAGRPYLQWLTDRGIDSLAETIHHASHANSIRWRDNFYAHRPKADWTQPSMPSPDSLKTFLTQRIAFLDKHWTHCVPYTPLYIQLPSQSSNVMADYQPGLTVQQYILQSHAWDDCHSLTWTDRISGRTYLPDTPVDTIVELHLQSKSHDTPHLTSSASLSERLHLATIALFLLILTALALLTVATTLKNKNTQQS